MTKILCRTDDQGLNSFQGLTPLAIHFRPCRGCGYTAFPSLQNSIRHSTFVILLFLLPCSLLHAADKVTYSDHVQPILREHCFACHNQDDATAGLALDSFTGLTTGGASGEVVAAGDPDGSRLWKLVSQQEEPSMPPDNKLPDAQLQLIKAWIEGGLLKDGNSKPIKTKRPAIAKLDTDQLGKPVGEPALPTELYHEPVLWTEHVGPISALATSPWAPVVAIGWQRQVSLYSTDDFRLLGILPYVDGVPTVVRFSRDGSLLLVAGGKHAAEGSVSLFDVKTGARLAKVGDELDIVLAADISPDLSLVALGGPKKRVRVYRVSDGALVYQLAKHTDWITSVGFSPDGQLLATADRNGGALLWQAENGLERADLRGHKTAITALDWRADSAMLATASEDGTARLWNPDGNQIKSLDAHKAGVLSVRFSQQGNFVTAGRDAKLRGWKPDGALLAELGSMNEMTLAAAFTHDGSRVIASDFTGQVQAIQVSDPKPVGTLAANPQPLAVRIANLQEQVTDSQQQVDQASQQFNEATATLQQAQQAHAKHDEQLAKLVSKVESLRTQPEPPTTEEDATTEETNETASTQLAAAEQQLAQLQDQNVGLPDLAASEKRVAESRSALADREADLARLTAEKEQLSQQQQRFASANVELAKQIEQQQTRQLQLTKETGELEAEQRQVSQELNSQQQQLTELAAQIQQLQERLEALEAGAQKLSADNDSRAAELDSKQAELVNIEQQLQFSQAKQRDLQAAEALRAAFVEEATRTSPSE